MARVRIVSIVLRWLVTLVFSAIPLISNANLSNSLESRYAITQEIWQNAQSYAHGLNKRKDAVQAYAWFHLYQDVLPADYPGIKATQKQFLKRLKRAERPLAQKAYLALKKQKRYQFRLNDAELAKLYAGRSEKTPQLAAIF